MAVPGIQVTDENPENTTYEEYRDHLAAYLDCDPAGGCLCRRGSALHDRWTLAQDAQREGER